jgi:hypothetical protein
LGVGDRSEFSREETLPLPANRQLTSWQRAPTGPSNQLNYKQKSDQV